TPEEIYESPVSTFVANFIGAVTLLKGQCTATGQLRLDSGPRLPLGMDARLAGRTVYVAIRPEDVQLVSTETRDALSGRVISSSYLGNFRRSLVEIAPNVRLQVEHREPLTPNTVVQLRITDYNLIEEPA
ncbi:MAG TPA: TOBE domain-containing protein, partial [Anaerolineae bacterium]|nr:TOBE domain-containing protein [Anaerolineae bacterium]